MKKLIERLRQYSESLFAYKLSADFADAVCSAADMLGNQSSDEEYRFWLNVRNTHAAINGKPQKDYTKAQMLTWYNKLHTDSSEYKMWGNGISLPTALYVMQGIAEALKGGEG